MKHRELKVVLVIFFLAIFAFTSLNFQTMVTEHSNHELKIHSTTYNIKYPDMKLDSRLKQDPKSHITYTECINGNLQSCQWHEDNRNTQSMDYQTYPRAMHKIVAWTSRTTGISILKIFSFLIPFTVLLAIPFLIFLIAKEIFNDEIAGLIASPMVFIVSMPSIMRIQQPVFYLQSLTVWTQGVSSAIALIGILLLVKEREKLGLSMLVVSTIFHAHIGYFSMIAMMCYILAKVDGKKLFLMSWISILLLNINTWKYVFNPIVIAIALMTLMNGGWKVRFISYISIATMTVALVAPVLLNYAYIRVWIIFYIVASPFIGALISKRKSLMKESIMLKKMLSKGVEK